MPTCPFRMVAGMLLDGQRAKIHAVGEGKSVPINIDCIGEDCMLFTVTGETKDGVPIGQCAPNAGALMLSQLNLKVDATVFAAVESVEEDFERRDLLQAHGHSLSSTVAGRADMTTLDHFAAKIRKLFNRPKPPLSVHEGGKDK